jgi:hypothetical protein
METLPTLRDEQADLFGRSQREFSNRRPTILKAYLWFSSLPTQKYWDSAKSLKVSSDILRGLSLTPQSGSTSRNIVGWERVDTAPIQIIVDILHLLFTSTDVRKGARFYYIGQWVPGFKYNPVGNQQLATCLMKALTFLIGVSFRCLVIHGLLLPLWMGLVMWLAMIVYRGWGCCCGGSCCCRLRPLLEQCDD